MERNNPRNRKPFRIWQGKPRPRKTTFYCVHCGKAINEAEVIYNQFYHARCLRLLKTFNQ